MIVNSNVLVDPAYKSITRFLAQKSVFDLYQLNRWTPKQLGIVTFRLVFKVSEFAFRNCFLYTVKIILTLYYDFIILYT